MLGFYYAIRQSKGVWQKMRRQYSRSSLFAALVVLAGLAMPAKPLAETRVSDLRTQIRDLAAAHGFIINGLERIGDDAATPVSGDLRGLIDDDQSQRGPVPRLAECPTPATSRHPAALNRLLLCPQQETFSWPSLTSGFDPNRSLTTDL